MAKHILLTIVIFLISQNLNSMRRPTRVGPRTPSSVTHLARPSTPRAVAGRLIIRSYHTMKTPEHTARQEALDRINNSLTERVCKLLDQAAWHAARADEHTNY